MKIKVSKYISQYLVDNGITDLFTVTGGGAMYLNDAFGHQKGLNCIYNHNEQASAIAAEAYYRIENKLAAVCVTSGPGATNAITGALHGYMDSIPMLIFSGQVRYNITARSTGLNLRTMGEQEYDICKSVQGLTKYCEMITDPKKIKYCLQKAIYISKCGRPGPVWLDIPLDVQGAIIETDELIEFKEEEYKDEIIHSIEEKSVDSIIKKLKDAERPVIFVGNGVRLAGAYDLFQEMVEKLNIPVVTGMSSVDLMCYSNPLYVGRSGGTGDRAGNFAIQNSDVLLSLGSRLSLKQVGFNYSNWAKNAFTIINDIDENELKKPTIHVDLPICGDVKELISMIIKKAPSQLCSKSNWINQCELWKNKYPVVQKKHYYQEEKANVYAFFDKLTEITPKNAITVVSVGSARVVGSQVSRIKEGQRFITNASTASMGYGLPAAIGTCIASNREKIIMVTGEGSLQMNIQELQTIIHNKLPIKIFVINNEGYHSIRQTQNNFFGKPLVGVGDDSGDLSFPDLSKLAPAYGFNYYKCTNNSKLEAFITESLKGDEPSISEVFVSIDQVIEPKATSRKLEDGTMISATLEDLYPFLSREELKENMICEK